MVRVTRLAGRRGAERVRPTGRGGRRSDTETIPVMSVGGGREGGREREGERVMEGKR